MFVLPSAECFLKALFADDPCKIHSFVYPFVDTGIMYVSLLPHRYKCLVHFRES